VYVDKDDRIYVYKIDSYSTGLDYPRKTWSDLDIVGGSSDFNWISNKETSFVEKIRKLAIKYEGNKDKIIEEIKKEIDIIIAREL